MSRPHLLDPAAALLAVVDVQTRHFPTVLDGPTVLERLGRLVETAKLLEVPILWTEQYPTGFGPTLPELAARLAGRTPIAKRSFGCFGVPEFVAAVEASGRRELYLVGVETAICIEQTALGALEAGLTPVVVADCVSARRTLDHELALRRMAAAGAVLVTWEMLAYEWLRSADHPRFKAVLELVKQG